MRKIKAIHKAVYSPIDDLETYRAIPTQSIDYLDPFLFLNHHGLQFYIKNNNGLPFGPHPHRGFETLTYVIKGDIAHKDSSGSESIIKEGGVQWMTAGSGLIHSEVSSQEFKENGGEVEIIQLWLNLAAKHKMVKPNYIGLPYGDICHFDLDNGSVNVDLISGNWGENKGPIDSLSNLTMTSIRLKGDGILNLEINKEDEILFYLVYGELLVNGEEIEKHQLVQFENDDTKIAVKANKDSYLILGYGKPFNEPMVAQGPFVMNTQQEIIDSYADFRSGKMGSWNN
jgi:redox-sensitive bicupin YhaK (pirin superfamily)